MRNYFAHTAHLGGDVEISGPLFGYSPLGSQWKIAVMGDKFPSDARDALLVLADHQNQLSAPVYFQVPEGEQEDPRWQTLISASQPQCRCPMRRMLVPTIGRARFVSHDLSQMRVIGQPDSSLVLLILPHGGDIAAAHMSWSVTNGQLICARLPMHRDRPQRQTITFGDDGPWTPDHLDDVMQLDYDRMQRIIRRRGEITCYRTLHNGTHNITVPVCSITLVRRDPDADNAITVTIELDAGVGSKFVTPDELLPPHVCVG